MTGPCREDNIFTDRKAGRMKILRRVGASRKEAVMSSLVVSVPWSSKCLQPELTCQISKCKSVPLHSAQHSTTV